MEGRLLTAAMELIQRAKAKMSEKGISFGEALRLVAQEDPELAAKCRAAVLKSETYFEAPPKKEQLSASPMARELNRLAREKMECAGLTFSEALVSVSRERPGLTSEHRKEVTGSKF